MDHRKAIAAYVKENPALKDAYDAWLADSNTTGWVTILFPGLANRSEREPYVLANALYAMGYEDPADFMVFSAEKAARITEGREPAIQVECIADLDVIAYYDRLELADLQALGI